MTYSLHNIRLGLIGADIMTRPRIKTSKELLLQTYEELQDWYAVAAYLGLSKSTIYRRLEEFGISKIDKHSYYTNK